jgi:hypothetical protein
MKKITVCATPFPVGAEHRVDKDHRRSRGPDDGSQNVSDQKKNAVYRGRGLEIPGDVDTSGGDEQPREQAQELKILQRGMTDLARIVQIDIDCYGYTEHQRDDEPVPVVLPPVADPGKQGEDRDDQKDPQKRKNGRNGRDEGAAPVRFLRRPGDVSGRGMVRSRRFHLPARPGRIRMRFRAALLGEKRGPAGDAHYQQDNRYYQQRFADRRIGDFFVVTTHGSLLAIFIGDAVR